MKNKFIKISFILLSILFVIPSIIYLIQNKTVMGFNTYYNFFINVNINKILSTLTYLIIFVGITALYLIIVNRKEMFDNIKSILKYVTVVSVIFLMMLPWTSSDIFYYMGVGELDSVYGQNPYYTTMKEYYEQNKENIEDEILEQGANNFWASTTVVYGPIAQLIFKICTIVSLKNINICLLVFKILNLIIHISNCYIIYKITRKKIFSIIYGLNPFILLEFIGNVHNDILLVFFVLLALYFLIKKEKILLSIFFLAIATGIKYFTILLLPIVIIYHFRNEEKIGKRFFKCIQYGLLFLLIFLAEYIFYFDNIDVMFAMLAQTSRYCKSIYSVLIITNANFMFLIRCALSILFVYLYICLCIQLLLNTKNNILNMLRKYNVILIMFLLILTNFQQWYLVWLFATIMWQKPNTIRNILGLTAITEIANSIYMFKSEWYIYDIYFVGFIICLFIIWQICQKNNQYQINKKEKINWIN